MTGLVCLGLGRGVREYMRTSGASCDVDVIAELDLLRLAFALTGSLDRGGGSMVAIGGDFAGAKTCGWR